MQIYSVLIKIWKLQIDLLWIQKMQNATSDSLPMQWSSSCFNKCLCRTATLLCNPGSGCYHDVEFLSCRHHKKRKSLFFLEPHTAGLELELRCTLEVICWVTLGRAVRGGAVAVVSSCAILKIPSLQLPRTKSLTQTFPLN